MKKISLIVSLVCLGFLMNATTIVIKNNGQTFSPNTVNASVGDTIDFQIQSFHNAIEVSKATWDANGDTPLEGGFMLPFAGGKTVMTKTGTIYYVCEPHASSGMKGSIVVAGVTPSTPTFKTTIVQNSGQAFAPKDITVQLGDTVHFQLQSFHNVVEVSKTVFDANGSTSNGGFLLPFGGGKVKMNRLGTIYYVCEPHAQFGMKGTITVTEVGEPYVARLSGTQEEFPVLSMGTGTVTARLNGDTLTVSGSFKNLTGDFNPAIAGGAHLHRGLAGASGGIQINLVATVDTVNKKAGTFLAANNKFVLTAAQKTNLLNRELYVNIHTTTSPSGEIRGQVVPESDAYYQANLVGSQEVPVVMTNAHGSIIAELKGTTLTVTGSASGIASGINTGIRMGGHLHLGYPGQNGGIQLELKPSLDSNGTSVRYQAADNTFTVTPNQIAALKAGQLYANIHSNAFGGGEIRGQVTPISTARFRAFLSGAYEAIPVNTLAGGGMMLTLNDSTLTAFGTFNGLESNMAVNVNGGAHIHRGMAGQNGGIQLVLKTALGADSRSGQFLADSNTFKLTAANLDDLFARRLYANIHSLNFTGGEIRGQVLPESQYYMQGYFSGMQENKAVITTGKGNVIAEVNGNRITVSGYAESLLDKVNRNIGSHLHRGQTGSNGPINIVLSYIHPTPDSLSVVYPASANSYSVTNAFLDSLRARQIYANIHTLKVGSGEIRAQLNGEAAAYFHTVLSGASETTPVNSKATGGLFAELPGNGSKNVILHGSFAGLEGKFNPAIAGGAHLHGGLPGVNGGIKYNLTTNLTTDSTGGSFLPANNVIALSDGNIDSLRKRMLYGNVHSTRVPSGEIRGNLLNLSNAVFTSSLSSLNEVPIVTGAGIGAIKAELSGTRLVVTGGFSGLTGEFNRNIAGGAHLHTGVNGVNGGVTIGLKAATSADNKSGFFVADSNTFTLTASQLSALNAGGLYTNIHTTTSAGGEIRGQVLSEPNNFPSLALITSPKTGDTVKLDTKSKDSVVILSWSASTDPDAHPVTYKAQISPVADFSVIINSLFVGPLTTVPISVKSLDSTLAAFGVQPGGSLTLAVRTVASDGSLNTLGTPAAITLLRVQTTGVIDEFAKSYGMIMFPVPASTSAILEINAKQIGQMDLRVVDLSGRIQHTQKLNITTGINRIPLDVTGYNTGTHFVQLYQKGNLVAYFKLMKQ